MPKTIGHPVTLHLDPPPNALSEGYECDTGGPDGSGNVALSWYQRDLLGEGAYPFQFFDVSGRFLGERVIWSSPLIEQLRGYIAMSHSTNNAYSIDRIGPDGMFERSTPGPGDFASVIAEDPLGGVVVWAAIDPTVDTGTTSRLIAYDAQGVERWELPLQPPARLDWLSVDREGNTLATFGSGNEQVGLWLDHEGEVLTPYFPITVSPTNPPALVTRVGNGFFLVADGGAWVGSIAPGSTQVAAPPEWLARRPATLLHMVHGGRGYAVIPGRFEQRSPCAQTIEVVAPDGTSCGKRTFQISEGTCAAAGLSIGYDGSVLQPYPHELETDCDANHVICGCTWQLWPHVFG